MTYSFTPFWGHVENFYGARQNPILHGGGLVLTKRAIQIGCIHAATNEGVNLVFHQGNEW